MGSVEIAIVETGVGLMVLVVVVYFSTRSRGPASGRRMVTNMALMPIMHTPAPPRKRLREREPGEELVPVYETEVQSLMIALLEHVAGIGINAAAHPIKPDPLLEALGGWQILVLTKDVDRASKLIAELTTPAAG